MVRMNDRTALLLSIHYLSGLRLREKLLLADLFDSLAQIRSLERSECESIIRRSLKTALFCPDDAVGRASIDTENLTIGNFGCTFYWDESYPPLLREIHDPPFALLHRGSLPDWRLPIVAVVGTRYPTGSGHSAAFRLGFELGRTGVPVVSGLAIGIDTDVHRGVVRSNGIAVAVLGNGIDFVYPKSNRRLAYEILDNAGCIVSEYGPGEAPIKYHFPARNRIIAGIAGSTVVVEAPKRSGALITADFALDEGRDLFVHRSGTTGGNSAGCAALLADGARAVEGSSDIFDEWNETTYEFSEGTDRALDAELSRGAVRYNGKVIG